MGGGFFRPVRQLRTRACRNGKPTVWKRLELDILRQPDNTTCGPTCLHAVYRFYQDELPLEAVIRETPQLEEGGTLAVLLGRHALSRGYRAMIYTYNLQVFDPTWFLPGGPDLVERLHAQLEVKTFERACTMRAARTSISCTRGARSSCAT